MNALDTLINIINSSLLNYDFKYCLVNELKMPFISNNVLARPNHIEDFVDLITLVDTNFDCLQNFKGIGVSIQASNICAIDIDDATDIPFSKDNLSNVAKDIINKFKSFAYIEFSFSGKGIRILFQSKPIVNYANQYYIKNSKQHLEYYYPEGSYRYVTVTGNVIYNNKIRLLTESEENVLHQFLNQYMKRQIVINNNNLVIKNDDRHINDLMKIVKKHYLTNHNFQDLWFTVAPGSGSNESERDYHLVAYLYDFITKDKDKIKQIFEQSPFFKSKDWKHINKWTNQNYRYYNYLYDRINRK